jgi:large subunit ribosomal protein L32
MAVPKKRTSKARKRSRRANWKLEAPNLSACPQCHQPRLAHRVCKSCGFYDGRRVLSVKTGASR